MEQFITKIGSIASYLSVFVWSATLALVVKCGDIPPLYVVGLAGVVLGVWQAAGEIRAGGLSSLKAPPGACLFEACGVTGYRVLVYPAMVMVDPVDAANLVNLWIAAVIVCSLLLAGRRFGIRHWLGILCAVAGTLAAVTDGIAAGHMLALAGGLVWVWYVVEIGSVEGRGTKASAIGNVAAGGFVMLLAYLAGNRLAIDGGDWLWFIALLIVSNCGMLLWEYGARHGEPRLVKISVLFLPLCAALWIWILGGVEPDSAGVFSAVAITAAGLILSPHVFKEARTAPLQR